MKDLIQKYAEAYAVVYCLEGSNDAGLLHVAQEDLNDAEREMMLEYSEIMDLATQWTTPKAFAWFIAGFSLSMIIFKFI